MARPDPFPGMGKAELKARIDNARLARSPVDDDAIARMALLEPMTFADIAAEVHCDRSTVSRHYHRIIEMI